jgi:hypothetical protein
VAAVFSKVSLPIEIRRNLKAIMALWRFLEHGLVPEGAVLRAAHA